MSEICLIGINDSDILLEGWHERQTHVPTGLVYRASQKNASFKLSLPKRMPKEPRLNILSASSPSLWGGSLRGTVLCCGLTLGDFSIETDFWRVISFPLNEVFHAYPKIPPPIGADNPENLTFSIIIENPFVPHIYLKNGDFREMGICLSASTIA